MSHLFQSLPDIPMDLIINHNNLFGSYKLVMSFPDLYQAFIERIDPDPNLELNDYSSEFFDAIVEGSKTDTGRMLNKYLFSKPWLVYWTEGREPFGLFNTKKDAVSELVDYYKSSFLMDRYIKRDIKNIKKHGMNDDYIIIKLY